MGADGCGTAIGLIFERFQGDSVKKRLEQERGASAVEFAIIASLLLMILFGTIQFGIAFNRYQGVQAASREGARLGSLPNTDVPTIVTRVQSSLSIIAAANMSTYPCPSNLNTLGSETGCITVSLKDSSGTLTEQSNNTTTHPCNTASGKSIVVQTSYRMRLNIPLWSSPNLPITGKGEFRCES